MIVYHVSPHKFDEFTYDRLDDNNNVGFHFGNTTTVAVVPEMLHRAGRVSAGDKLYVYTVEVPDAMEDSNFLRLTEPRGGKWNITSVLSPLFDDEDPVFEQYPDSFTEDDFEDFWGDQIILSDGSNLYDEDGSQAEMFADYMKHRGIDGVVYNNLFEGGGDSFVVFDAGDIDILDVDEMVVPEYGERDDLVPAYLVGL